MSDDLSLIRGELARRELARRDFRQYLPYVQGPAWKKTRMSDFIAYRVQEFLTADTGNAYDILVVKTPPQHGKSMTLSETLPSWYLGRFPTKRVIMASYNEDTAQKFCRRNADKLRQYGHTLFGVSLAIDRSTEIELDNRQGRMISRGIMSGITGNPADLIIIDDPSRTEKRPTPRPSATSCGKSGRTPSSPVSPPGRK